MNAVSTFALTFSQTAEKKGDTPADKQSSTGAFTGEDWGKGEWGRPFLLNLLARIFSKDF